MRQERRSRQRLVQVAEGGGKRQVDGFQGENEVTRPAGVQEAQMKYESERC